MARLVGDEPFNDAERAAMYASARSLVGLEFRHQGRTAKGADCIGFGWLLMAPVVLQFRGIELPKPRADYGRTPWNQKLRAEMILYLGEPVAGEPRPGDYVTLRWRGEEHHVAMLLPHPERPLGIIHADNRAAGPQGPRVVEHGVDEAWRKRFVEWWRP